MPKTIFIKDAIYGYLIFNAEKEGKLIDTFPVQRMKRIRQLSGSEYVYVTATHCRFSHSLGVSHLAEQLIMNLLMKNEQLASNDEHERERLATNVKIAALLHDIGHSSFSHVFESILSDLGKNHEDMTEWLIKESELADLLIEMEIEPKEISQLAVGKLPGVENKYLNQVISSGIDVDSFDYIVRDSQFSGAEYGFVDILRLIYTMDVDDKDFNLIVNKSALNTLEAFVIARYESFKSIYFHKTSRAVQIMLANALHAAKDELGLTSFEKPEDYLKWDDYTMHVALLKCEKSKPIIEDLYRRKLLKVAYEKSTHVKDQTLTSFFNNPRVKEQIQAEIAEKAKVEMTEIFIDLPNLPSVPYHTYSKLDPLEIPIFELAKDGSKVIKKVSELSSVIGALKGFLNIVRIYTEPQLRERVGEAARKVFGE